MTPEQKLALIEYSVRGSSTKAILEDDDTGLFENVSRGEVEAALDEFADILRAKVQEEALFAQEEADATSGRRSDERIEFLTDILITAVESGIDYWAVVRNYSHERGTVEIAEDADESGVAPDDAEWHFVDVNVIERGLMRIKRPEFQINKTMRGWIVTGDATNDACDIDALAADAVIQAALFGELVYG